MLLISLQGLEATSTETTDNELTSEATINRGWIIGCQRKMIGLFLLLLYNVYLAYAIYFHITEALEDQWDWCEGLGFLLVLTALIYLGNFK